MFNWKPTRVQLEKDLTSLIATELAAVDGAQVYVVMGSETDIDFGDDIVGLTSPTMASWLKPEIGDRWRGEGPCMVINDAVTNFGLPCPIGVMNAIACHELAHIVLEKNLFQPAAKFAVLERRQARRVIENNNGCNAPDHLLCPGKFLDSADDHGCCFLRLMLHIGERLDRLCKFVPLNCMIDWSFYPTSDPWRFLLALDREIDRLWDTPLSEVARMPMPLEFMDVWNEGRPTDRTAELIIERDSDDGIFQSAS